MSTVPLGPFLLSERIGVGGMGEVWRGHHVQQRVPVAVKVITAARARQQKYHDAFTREVRAVAGLEHPGLVMVFDYGIVGEEAEATSEGDIVAGSPYLAMELATASRAQRPLPSSWLALRTELLALLDSLAHAHARGVIHRDLKLGNVLLFEKGGQPTRYKLADFGLAHAADGEERGLRGTSGTPLYMAPEQFHGAWRDFGPWTDLYAIGCLSWLLTSGTPPYDKRAFSDLMRAHLLTPVPPVRPRFALPDGFDDWVRRLMQKEPQERFLAAADASAALLELAEPKGQPQPAVAPVASPESTATLTLSPSFVAWLDEDDTGSPLESPSHVDNRPLPRRRLAPAPSTWRAPGPTRRSMRLVGAGLGLFGLRTVPLVGRDDERDVAWNALLEAAAERAPRAVIFRGQAGTGKTRLAEWLGERASEVGLAIVAHAEHSRASGPGDGLSAMVIRLLRCHGLSRVEARDRTQQWLERRGVTDPWEVDALVEVMWPSTPGRGDKGVRFDRPSERYAVITRLLGLVSRAGELRTGVPRSRAIVLRLDDIQWSSDALGLAKFVLEQRAPLTPPILVLATVRDEAVSDREGFAEQLNSLIAMPGATPVVLGPLLPEHRRTLVQELLGLEGELAAQVEERTAGNPLFAVQLVGDWVHRGVLDVGTTGFVLRTGELAPLPDDIHSLWEARIDRVLQGESAGRPALELAALLGNTVEPAEWRAACRIGRLPAAEELVDTLIAHRLAVQEGGRWAFAHGMLRESLERSAREDGRWIDLHDAAATALQIRADAARDAGLVERIGRHLFEAERYEEALEALEDASEERRAMSDYADAERLRQMWVETMRRLGLPPSDARRGRALALEATLLLMRGRLLPAEGVALRAIELGERHGWREVLAGLHHTSGMVAAKRGALGVARERIEWSADAARATGDDYARGIAQLALGDICRLMGHFDDARRLCRDALSVFTALGESRWQAEALLALAGIARVTGKLESCEDLTRRAIRMHEAANNRFGLGNCYNTLGEVLRGRGDLAEAEAAYQRSEALLSSLGSPEQLVPRLNLGVVRLTRRRFDKAAEVLVQVLRQAMAEGRGGLEAILRALLLPCAAYAGAWPTWREHYERCSVLLRESGLVDADVAWAVELAADLAQQAGADEQYDEALTLALAQYRGLGDEDAVQRMLARLTRE